MSQAERRLAAIMYTDMVGYTSLGQKDESLSLALVDEQRKLIRPILAAHHGREVKTMGDAFLVEFRNALDAVKCAFEIQKGTREHNSSLAKEERIHLRVGIHLGDIVESQGDILGDAVNVASRIEPISEDGGVCLSRQVYDHVQNKFDRPFVSLGTKSLKNVALPVEVFKMVMPWESAQPSQGSGFDRHRVAVLPFRNMSPDPSDGYFAEGMTEELITTLSKVGQLNVIARTSMMHYRDTSKRVSEISQELGAGTLIEGSVRKSGNRVRITVQLLDSTSEGHLWAENYDRQLDDIFAIQSEVAEKVVKELKVQLGGTEKRALGRSPTADPEVYVLYLKGRHYWNERTREGVQKAIGYFTQATERDPGFALGYAGLADCHQVMARNRHGEFGPNFQKAKAYVTKALELDEDLAEAHTTLGAIRLYYERDWKGSEAEFKKAIELKPSYATAHQWYAHVLEQQLKMDEAQGEILLARNLDPFSFPINHNVGAGHYYYGHFDEAIDQWMKVRELDPDYLGILTGPPGLIEAYSLKGNYQEAMNQVERLAQLSRSPKEVKLWRAYVLASMGRQSEAKELLAQVQDGYQTENVSAYGVAQVWFVLGDNDNGFKWLEKAYSDYDGSLNQLALDFELKGVRDDPRYTSMLRKIGLGNIISSR